MDRQKAIFNLKERLLHDVDYLCRRDDVSWANPIVKTLRSIRDVRARAVFFGGTLRSLLVARLDEVLGRESQNRSRIGRPRDIDIVVKGVELDMLRRIFKEDILRETRFGGLKLQRDAWEFDVWPLDRTWAFTHDCSEKPDFRLLPSTTFFNLEAIAVDVWPGKDGTRKIYSGNDQFFEGILSQTLEINREENPYPALCVVRGLVMARSLRFSIGPRLARYLVFHGAKIDDAVLAATQWHHYGAIRISPRVIREWLRHISNSVERDDTKSVQLPVPRQLELWSLCAGSCSQLMREDCSDDISQSSWYFESDY